MKEIHVVKTKIEQVIDYWDRIVIDENYPPENSFEGDATVSIFETSKEYNIQKMCTVINNKLTVREYVITDPFLEEMLLRKDREWSQCVSENTRLYKIIMEKDKAYAQLVENYEDLKAQPLISIFWDRLLYRLFLIKKTIKSKFRRDI